MISVDLHFFVLKIQEEVMLPAGTEVTCPVCETDFVVESTMNEGEKIACDNCNADLQLVDNDLQEVDDDIYEDEDEEDDEDEDDADADLDVEEEDD